MVTIKSKVNQFGGFEQDVFVYLSTGIFFNVDTYHQILEIIFFIEGFVDI